MRSEDFGSAGALSLSSAARHRGLARARSGLLGPRLSLSRIRPWLAAILLAAAIVLGGGGTPAPLPEMLLQLVATLCAAVWLFSSGLRASQTQPLASRPRLAMLTAGLLIIIPVLQLVPLPPGLWHALPGREAEQAALGLISQADSWRSWSLLPSRTLAALLAMAVPAMLLTMVAHLDQGGRNRLIGVIIAGGLATLLIGAVQMSGQGMNFYSSQAGMIFGLQANHNSTADLLLMAMLATAAWTVRQTRNEPDPRRAAVWWALLAGVSLLLALGVYLTGSRAGTALVLVAVLAQLLIVGPSRLGLSKRTLSTRKLLVLAGILLLIVAAASLGAIDNSVIGQFAQRFTFNAEFRPSIWVDAWFAVRQYWPFGSGMGTFVPIFMPAERLEVLDEFVANRAHNDFLELALEAGLAGIAVLVSILAIIIVAARRAWPRAGSEERANIAFSLAALLILGLHSLVDYPLRSMSLACVAATAAGLILAPRLRGSARTTSVKDFA